MFWVSFTLKSFCHTVMSEHTRTFCLDDRGEAQNAKKCPTALWTSLLKDANHKHDIFTDHHYTKNS